jgi:hypothetical protein
MLLTPLFLLDLANRISDNQKKIPYQHIKQKALVSSPFPSYFPLSWWCMLILLTHFDWMAGTAWVL